MKKEEHRKGWTLGVAPGHYITLFLSLLAFAVGYGALGADVESNAKSNERIEQKFDKQMKTNKKEIMLHVDKSNELIRDDIKDLNDDVRQIRDILLKK